jgi:hypothetical protein
MFFNVIRDLLTSIDFSFHPAHTAIIQHKEPVEVAENQPYPPTAS